MVQDDRLCQLLLLSSDGTTVADTEAVRLRGCLPYMLHEEWYSSGPGSNKVVVVDDRTTENSECTSSGSDDDDAGYDDENKNNQEVHERRMEEQPHDLGSIRVHLLQSLAAMVARSGVSFRRFEPFCSKTFCRGGMGLIAWVASCALSCCRS